MEFIEQMENLFEVIEKKLSIENFQKFTALKRTFNDDLNLFGSFIKDYLCSKNNYLISDDNMIFEDFMSYFELKSDLIGADEIIKDMSNYSKYYYALIFEDVSCFNSYTGEIEAVIATINSLFIMEIYPYLMNKFDSFVNLKIDGKNFVSMLKSIIDVVLQKYENSEINSLDLRILDYEVNKKIVFKKSERLVG